MKFYVVTNSFAAPFFSDTGERYVEAESAEAALELVADTYTHPCGLYAAAAYASHEAKLGKAPALATWLCNAEIAKQEATKGKDCYTSLGISPEEFEIDGVRHKVHRPKEGRVVVA